MWEPLLIDRRDEVVRTIATLVARVDASERTTIDQHVDHALLHAYLAADELAEPDASGLSAALQLVGADDALFGGAARVGFALAHLADGDDVEAACAAIDQRLIAHVDRAGFDVIGGLAGQAVYALERGDSAITVLRGAIASHLIAASRPYGDGLAWFTQPEQLVPEQRAAAPDGYWNLGLAHGLAGAIAALARLHVAGCDGGRGVVASAIEALHTVPAPANGDPRFPGWLPADRPSRQLAWCYGDLGIAHALVGAGLYCGEPAWRDEGVALARACAERATHAMIVDRAICHGLAGVAHIFTRLANSTGDAVLAGAARTWLEATLADPREPTDATLLEGNAGIALVLAAAISETEPLWDRLLLLDLPTP